MPWYWSISNEILAWTAMTAWSAMSSGDRCSIIRKVSLSSVFLASNNALVFFSCEHELIKNFISFSAFSFCSTDSGCHKCYWSVMTDFGCLNSSMFFLFEPASWIICPDSSCWISALISATSLSWLFCFLLFRFMLDKPSCMTDLLCLPSRMVFFPVPILAPSGKILSSFRIAYQLEHQGSGTSVSSSRNVSSFSPLCHDLKCYLILPNLLPLSLTAFPQMPHVLALKLLNKVNSETIIHS